MPILDDTEDIVAVVVVSLVNDVDAVVVDVDVDDVVDVFLVVSGAGAAVGVVVAAWDPLASPSPTLFVEAR